MTFPTLKPRGESVKRLREASMLLRKLKALLNAEGPLVAFDLEGTGPFPEHDRICEIGAVKVRPDGTYAMLSTLINPQMPISAGASEKTGVTDAMVQDAPKFIEVAPLLGRGLQHCALVGYNARRYDIPLLQREFAMAGFNISLEFLPLIDPFAIYQEKEPRDLDAAVRRFCKREREAAHEAGVDVLDMVDVLLGQLTEFPDLPRDIDALATLCDRKKPEFIDRAGKFQWRDGVPIVAFSKWQGTPMTDVDPGFYRWMLDRDFPADTREIALRALDGQFPVCPPELLPVRSESQIGTTEVSRPPTETGLSQAGQTTQAGLFT